MASLLVQLREVIGFCNVVKAAEIANPTLSIVNELDKGIDVGSALAASHEGLLVESGRRHLLPARQLSKRLDEQSQGHAQVFLERV